ncbi:MAG: CHAT domain-containing protein [Balneolaceae bacterium]|nr:MAG: CHAT domain-containing protein [Balneolaceae bacterium]
MQKYLTIVLLSLFTSLHADEIKLQNISNSEADVLNNWLMASIKANQIAYETGESALDVKSEQFFDLYQSTQNIAYLTYAYHEANSIQRAELFAYIYDNDDLVQQLPDHFLSYINNTIDSSYYKVRDFSLYDIYTFTTTSIPSELETEARKLLEHWYDRLESAHQNVPIEESFKIQALIHGYDNLNNFQKVHELGSILVNENPFPSSYFSLNLFDIISYSSRVLGYYSQALSINQQILQPIANELGNDQELLTIKLDYALLLFRVGNVNASLTVFEDVFNQDYSILDSRYQATLFNNLAISYLNAGQFDRYVEFQLNAFEIASSENNYSQQLSILRNLFIYYRRQNETELAFNYLNQALQIARDNDLTTEIASILISLGIYKKTVEQNFEEALYHYYSALQLSTETNNYQHHYMSYLEIGETYLLKQDWYNAEYYFKNALQLTFSREDTRSYTQAAIRYSNMLIHQGRYEETERLLYKLDHKDLATQFFNIQILYQNVKTRLLKQKKHIDNAVALSTSSITEILDHLRESSDMQTGHMRMDEEFSEAFKLHTMLMYETGQYEKALSVIGELRNISRAGFYNNPLLKSKVLSEEELIQDFNLSTRIQQLRSRYQTATGEQRVYLGNELLNAISERNRLQSKAFPNYNERQYDQLFRSLRRELKPDQMIFYFTVFDEDIFQFVITRRDIKMNIYTANDNYLELLRSGINTIGYRSTDLHKLHDIYTAFFDGNIPATVSHIYMIPDGDFYRLPLEILPVNRANTTHSFGTARYLIEDYSISYLNSLTELINERQTERTDFAYDMVGFGIENFEDAGHSWLQNLPFSSTEIKNSYEKLYSFNNRRIFLESESTEQNFRNIAGNSRILHLATHSMVNDENPLFSSLFLFSDEDPNSPYDGIIHAYELFDMNLNADLIFLSSCESGAGGYLQGSGILGFSRAFSFAGARSLAMNLWPVRDQTASDISINFYEWLNSGENKAESIRQARLKYLNNTNSDPYLWGSFVIYGDIHSPLPRKNYFASIFFLSLGFVIIFGSSFIILTGNRG